MFDRAYTLEEQLAELRAELAIERRHLHFLETAPVEGRVADEVLYLETLRRAEGRVAELGELERGLIERMEVAA